MRSNFAAINARTISVNGVPIAGSGTPTAPYTTFDQLDDSMSIYLNGALIQGSPAAGAISQYGDINVLSGVSLAGAVVYGVASTPATNAATGPLNSGGGSTPALPTLTLTGPIAFTAGNNGAIVATVVGLASGETVVSVNVSQLAVSGANIIVGLGTATVGSLPFVVTTSLARTVGGTAAVSAAIVPIALPSVASSPTILAGTYPAVSGYTGPLVRVQNASGVQMDIVADGSGYTSVSAILNFCGVSTIDGVLVTTAYDQSGAHNDLTQTVTANMPKLTVGVNGKPTIFFDGASTYFNLPSISTSIASFTLLHTSRYIGGAIVQFGTASGAYQNLGITSNYGTYRLSMGNSARTTPQQLFTNNALICWQSSASALKIGQNTPVATTSPMVAATYSGGLVGASTVVTGQYFSGNMTMFALYPALSDADASSVSAVMQSNEAISSGRTKNLVMAVDSLTVGFQSTYNRSRFYYLEQSIGSQANIYIVAQAGRTTATENSIYAAQVAPLYVPGQTNVFASFGGTNDLHVYSAYSPETDSTTPTAEYSVKTLNQTAQQTGYTVVAYDIPVSSAAGANRTPFNAWLDANVNSWASYRVDFQQSPAYGGPTSALQTAYASGDGIHPNSAGYQVFAAWELPTIKYALGLATAPASPVNSVLPSISGTASVGSTATVTPGVWSNSPTQLAYQWKRNGTNIQDANGTSYTFVSADSGTTVTVSEAASIANGNVGYVAVSAGVSVSGATGSPSNTAAPTISGTPVVGDQQTASTGSWTNSPTSYAYQWYLGGAAISGATGSTYTPTNTGSLTVSVTAVNASGSATSTSSAVTIGAALAISGNPPSGTVNTAYSYMPAVSGGSGTRTFSQSGTALPAGLSFSSSTGAITGTPTAAATTSGIVITVTDASGAASETVSITITASGGGSITADSTSTTSDSNTVTADHQ